MLAVNLAFNELFHESDWCYLVLISSVNVLLQHLFILKFLLIPQPSEVLKAQAFRVMIVFMEPSAKPDVTTAAYVRLAITVTAVVPVFLVQQVFK